jgi:hypothetical protein
MTIWQNLALLVTGCALNVVLTMVIFHWKKREEKNYEIPSDFIQRFHSVEEHVVNLRIDMRSVKRDLGMNGGTPKKGLIT